MHKEVWGGPSLAGGDSVSGIKWLSGWGNGERKTSIYFRTVNFLKMILIYFCYFFKNWNCSNEKHMEHESGRGEMAMQSINQIRTASWADPACPASFPSEDSERNRLMMALWLPCRHQVPLLSWLPSNRLSATAPKTPLPSGQNLKQHSEEKGGSGHRLLRSSHLT